MEQVYTSAGAQKRLYNDAGRTKTVRVTPHERSAGVNGTPITRYDVPIMLLAIVVIGDDDKLAAREGIYRRADTLLSVVHIFVFAPRRATPGAGRPNGSIDVMPRERSAPLLTPVAAIC